MVKMYDPYMLQQNPYNRYASVSPANAPISQFQTGGQIVRVNGYQGAQAYQMGANAAAVLFDANEDIFYKKITDGAGFASIEIYSQYIHTGAKRFRACHSGKRFFRCSSDTLRPYEHARSSQSCAVPKSY